MKLADINQIDLNTLKKTQIDSVIAGLGYESRSIHLARLLAKASIKDKQALAFNKRKELARNSNEDFFKKQKYKISEFSGDDSQGIQLAIKEVIEAQRQEDVSILIDYSCMTRVWYAAVLDCLVKSNFKKNVSIYFSYTPAKFIAPAKEDYPDVSMGPIPGFSNFDLPEKPTALIMGLGYDFERALGLYEYIDPAETFVFYTDPSHEPKFTKEVLKNNKSLLEALSPNQVFKYPMFDLIGTSRVLMSLALGLEVDYRVILAPLGPKPFSLLCLLLSLRYQDRNFDVWRVSLEQTAKAMDREAIGDPIICRVDFSK